MPSLEKNTLIKKLCRVVPRTAVLHHEEQLRPYECDGLSVYRALPLAVVLPETTEQVMAIMKLCSELGVPVVARGAGTGLSGGALPLTQGIVLSFAKLNRVLDLDPTNRTACVQPGVRNLAISEAALPWRLYYAPDPSSQIACTIGGNVAENAGGVHCLKYGLTVHNVLQIKVVTVEGELITLGGSGLDASGYDLLALFTGSEGMLGMTVEITVKLLPRPPHRQVILAAFQTVEAAGQAVAQIIAAGIIPAGLEMMDNLAIRASEAFLNIGYPTEAEAILLCELDGIEAEVIAQVAKVQHLLTAANAYEMQVATDEQHCQLIWQGRKAAFPAVGRMSPDYYCMDGTIPRRQLAAVLNGISDLSKAFALPVANVFHAGDGNLHPLILYDANKPGELAQAEALGNKILALCVAAGGTVTGEHGVGIEKIDAMCTQFDTPALTQFHAIKAAFDPHHLLNPGKAIPTLHRCAELGAMHVHHGQLPFANLERF